MKINIFDYICISSISIPKYASKYCTKSIQMQSFSGPYFPAFELNSGKYGPEKLHIWTLFAQCKYSDLDYEPSYCYRYSICIPPEVHNVIRKNILD